MSLSRSSSPARRSGRPSQETAQGLAERILAAARALFLAQGFAATSVQQVAQAAGVTKRTVYVKVGDKDALFAAVMGELMRGWRHSVVDADGGGDLRQRLERIGQQLLAAMLAPDMVRLHRVLAAETYRFPALIELLMQQTEDGPIPQLARLLHADRGGDGAPTREDQVAARLLHEMIVSAGLRSAVFGRAPTIPISREDWVRAAVALFLHGWRGA